MQANRSSASAAPIVIGMARDELAYYLRVRPDTVDGWLSGEKQRPPYFDMAVKAAREKLHPVPSSLVKGYAEKLGLTPGHVQHWIDTGQVPVPARMAVAWIIHNRITGRG